MSMGPRTKRRGLSMGGAIVVRFLATGGIPVGRAIIDGGILPYTCPKWVCKLIHMVDFIAMRSVTRSRKLLELVAPPEKYTAEGSDSKEEYDALMEHGELVMIHLSQFDKEIKKALEA